MPYAHHVAQWYLVRAWRIYTKPKGRLERMMRTPWYHDLMAIAEWYLGHEVFDGVDYEP